jgi:hypothetical protein
MFICPGRTVDLHVKIKSLSHYYYAIFVQSELLYGIFMTDKTRRTEHHRTLPHTQDQTQHRRPTMKEHDHHWDSQQDFEHFINFNSFKY